MRKIKSRIIFLIHDHNLINFLFGKIKYKFLGYSKSQVSKENQIGTLYCGYNFNCEHPNSFNEYIVWLKLFYKNDLWKNCADKIGCKLFLEDKGFDKFLPKTYGIYENSSAIDIDNLPTNFVLKTNHDCGSVFICDKYKTNFKRIFNILDKNLLKKYNTNNNEWVYESIKPKIFAEELLISNEHKLNDYKFFIFNGKFRFGFMATDRETDTKFYVFGRDFEPLNTEYIYLKPKKSQIIKPFNFDDMVNLAEKVGSYFSFVRVDLYNTTKGIMIGELTFFSQSGHGSFTNKEMDYMLGNYFKDTEFYKLSKN